MEVNAISREKSMNEYPSLSEKESLTILQDALYESGPKDFINNIPDEVFVRLNVPTDFFKVLRDTPIDTDKNSNIIELYSEIKLMNLVENGI